jgi:hypothetical protein
MRTLGPILLALAFLSPAAAAKTPKKKKPAAPYNAAEYIKTKNGKTTAAGTDTAAVQASTVAGYDVNCTALETSPTAAPTGPVDKEVTDKGADTAAVNSTQKALEMAKTVVKTVKDNCRAGKPAKDKARKDGSLTTIEPEVGVSVTNPGDAGAKESKGERPELSGTVGVNATF